MNSLKLCTVVIGKTLDAFLSQLQKAQAVADFVELRVDYIENITSETLHTIANHTNTEAILCCRAKRDGGHFLGTLEEQNKILQTASDLGFDYIDIDLNIADKIVIQNNKAKIIISYHNFEATPELKTLTHIANHMRALKPDILKFAAMVNNENDIKNLFKLLLDKKHDEKMIVLGMGPKGKITRLLAPFLGGYLTFVSVNETSSASGQMDIQIVQDIYHKLCQLLK